MDVVQNDDVAAPHLNDDGSSAPGDPERQVRLYRSIDTRLMFGDFFAKLRLNFNS